jgi:hypothetical protein
LHPQALHAMQARADKDCHATAACAFHRTNEMPRSAPVTSSCNRSGSCWRCAQSHGGHVRIPTRMPVPAVLAAISQMVENVQDAGTVYIASGPPCCGARRSALEGEGGALLHWLHPNWPVSAASLSPCCHTRTCTVLGCWQGMQDSMHYTKEVPLTSRRARHAQ